MRRFILVVLLAAGCARESHPVDDSRPRLSGQAGRLSSTGTGTESLVQQTTVSTTGEVQRNIFAYREPPPVVVVAKKAPVQVMQQAPLAIQDVMPAPQPQAPPFGYRCIGTFGSDSHRFAVFTNGDGVVNVSVGEVVGHSQFVLREIGVESVTVAANAFTQRIEIGR